MSDQDRLSWKGKYIGGENPRVEIRTCVYGANLLAIVSSDGGIRLSTNGPLIIPKEGFSKLELARKEALSILKLDVKAVRSYIKDGMHPLASTAYRLEEAEFWPSLVCDYFLKNASLRQLSLDYGVTSGVINKAFKRVGIKS